MGVWRLMLVRAGIALLLCLAFSATASAASPEAVQAAQEAQAAEQAQDWDRALKLYELAYRHSEDAIYIYKRILIYERRGEPSFALSLLEENRAALSAHPEISDLVIVEQRLREKLPKQTPGGDGRGGATVAWVSLGAGAALVIGGGVALWMAQAEAEERACGFNSDAFDGGCDAPASMTRAEFDSSQRAQTTWSVVGGAGVALGLGALGYGIWRLAAGGDGAQTSGHELMISPGRSGAAVQWRWVF